MSFGLGYLGSGYGGLGGGQSGGRWPGWSDNFTRADGAIGTATSGHVYSQVPANGASRVLSVISGNTLVTPNRPDVGVGATAAYNIIDNTRTVTRMRATVSWTPGANNASVGLILTKNPAGADANYITVDGAVHPIFSTHQCTIGTYVGNVLTPVGATFNYTDMLKDGTQYQIGYDLIGTEMTVYGPYGETTTRSAAAFATYAGRYATLESFWAVSPSDCRPVIHSFSGR